VGDLLLGPGRYYVDGLMVENPVLCRYTAQPSLGPTAKLEAGHTYVAYLDVWERHVTYIEDESIREVALGGPDTCTRVQTIWQVKVRQCKTADPASAPPAEPRGCVEVVEKLREWKSGTMAARLQESAVDGTPCVLPPESRYRGLENHLYRIEIHAAGNTQDVNRVPTFKWSRKNGSVVTRWLGTTGNDIRVENSRGFAAGQYVEMTTETDDLNAVPGPLSRIMRIDGDVITLESAPAWKAEFRNPKIRRWDQTPIEDQPLTDGAVAIQPGTGNYGWIEIEDGIEIQFSEGEYRSGDYWLIPARGVTGDIVWPDDGGGNANHVAPAGIVHHYAPLFIVESTGTAPFVKLHRDCRCRFAPLPIIGGG